MGLSDGTFFMIKHTPLPNGNHPISSPVCPMGVADTLEPSDYISSVVVIFWKFPSLMIFNLYRRCYKPEATDATIKRNTLLPVNQTDGAIL